MYLGTKSTFQEEKTVVKLIIGARGSGKTKNLIEQVNAAAAVTKGSVICVEYGNTLNFDVTYKARLVDTTAFGIESADGLYGFIAGLAASDHDITDIFVDSSLKICGNDVEAFEKMLGKLDKITAEVNLVMTSSIAVEECPDGIKAYV